MTMKNMLVVASLSALPLASAYAGAEAAVSSEPSAEQEMRQACQAAIPQYLATLKANPNDAVSHNLLGTCRQRLGKQKAAIREYESAVKLNPNYAQAYNNLGTVYHTRGKYDKAVAQYEKAIALNPGLAAAHRNLGTALLALGKTEEGFAAYAEAQRLDATILAVDDTVPVGSTNAALAQQYFYFAKIAARSGQVDSAIEFLRKAHMAGFHGFDKVRSDPDFNKVVSDSRFATVAR
jgi:tetratricopeptide (TPR) repeat protein